MLDHRTLTRLLGGTALWAAALLTSPVLAEQAGGPATGQGQSSESTSASGQQGRYERLDTNQDGTITRAEALAARQAVFDRADVNRDGVLDRSELATEGQRQRQARGAMREGERAERGPRLPKDARIINRERRNPDANNDGVVTRQEWDAVHATASAENMARLFAQLDTNSDGQITTEEFRNAPMPPGGQRRKRVVERATADRTPLDADNDGRITRQEWSAQVDRMFERGDTNRDGQITRDEARSAWRAGVRNR